ncbi:MAG: hypothetical protein Kow0088_03430 [Anaerolineales bacterium]
MFWVQSPYPFAQRVISAPIVREALVFLILSLLLLADPQESRAGFEIPDGFKLLRSSVGVQLYRKDYPSGTPDYVQVIRLDRGAEVRLLHGKTSHQGATSGVFGGLDVRFSSNSIVKYWEELFTSTRRAFCVTNGQFFYMYEYPTRLPFPLKVNGRVVSGGYSKGEFVDQKLMLEIWKDHAEIRPLTKVGFQQSTAPNIVAGLSEDARKSPEKYVGRTFVGIADHDADGVYETMLIFSTQAARQRDAAETLRRFGADKVMMLDGGLSTQLVCQGKAYIQTERIIPQAIAVLDGTRPYIKPQQPRPIRPKQEMSEIQSQPGRELAHTDVEQRSPPREDIWQDNPSTIALNGEDRPRETAKVHPTDILFIPLVIFLISFVLIGFFRRLWLH